METKNLLLPSLSNRKCVGLGLLNRAPEAALDLKMYEIRRDYVKFKEDTRVEEGKMWEELYNNDRELKKSFVSKYSRQQVLHNKELFFLPRMPSYSVNLHHSQTEAPFAERYKQFVTFKANTMRAMHLRRSERRPNYVDLYAKQFNKKHKNEDNFHKILIKFENKRKEGNGPLNILKENTPADKTGSDTGSEVAETERPKQNGRSSRSAKSKKTGSDMGWPVVQTKRSTQNGLPSRMEDAKETMKDHSPRQRKIAVTNGIIQDVPRLNTLSNFETGLSHGKSRPPQLTKYHTIAANPMNI